MVWGGLQWSTSNGSLQSKREPTELLRTHKPSRQSFWELKVLTEVKSTFKRLPLIHITIHKQSSELAKANTQHYNFHGCVLSETTLNLMFQKSVQMLCTQASLIDLLEAYYRYRVEAQDLLCLPTRLLWSLMCPGIHERVTWTPRWSSLRRHVS